MYSVYTIQSNSNSMQESNRLTHLSPKRKRSESSVVNHASSASRRKTEMPLPTEGGSTTRTLVFRNLRNVEQQPVFTHGSPKDIPVESPCPEPEAPTAPLSPCPLTPWPISPKLWWQPAEITGLDHNDPADDGYGINGIGFIPTPAVANARLKHRKRQLAEWKSREAKEARQKRVEMRRGKDIQLHSLEASNTATLDEAARKVRFLEPQS